MRKCYNCLEVIPLGEGAKSYPLDKIDREILGFKKTRKMLYLHRGCYQRFLYHQSRKRKAHTSESSYFNEGGFY
jgi:hypothetical protein